MLGSDADEVRIDPAPATSSSAMTAAPSPIDPNTREKGSAMSSCAPSRRLCDRSGHRRRHNCPMCPTPAKSRSSICPTGGRRPPGNSRSAGKFSDRARRRRHDPGHRLSPPATQLVLVDTRTGAATIQLGACGNARTMFSSTRSAGGFYGRLQRRSSRCVRSRADRRLFQDVAHRDRGGHPHVFVRAPARPAVRLAARAGLWRSDAAVLVLRPVP